MNDDSTKPRLDLQTLEQILDVAKQLARPFRLPELLTQVVDTAREVLAAERGSVFLYESDTDEFVSMVATGEKILRFPANRGLLGEATSRRAIVNVSDCYADPRFNRDSDEATGFRTRCVLTVPLIGHDDCFVGALQLLNKNDGVFDARDERVAAVLAVQCAVALQRARMTEELLTKERMDEELAIGRQIQLGMLPSDFGVFRQRDDCDLYAMLEPAREIGGDFYDFRFIDDHRMCFCIGDVCGKGVPAALFMAVTKTMLEFGAETNPSTASIMTHVNERLFEKTDDSMFVTVFLGILDLCTGELTYTNAGHNPPYVKSKDGSVKQLDWTHGPIVGALRGQQYREDRLSFEPHDLLVLYTDGVTEAIDREGEMFSEERLTELLESTTDDGPAAIVRETFAAVKRFENGADPADDVTVLALRYRPVR